MSLRFPTSCFVPGYAERRITKKPRPPYYGKRQPLGSKIPNSTTLSLCPMTSFAKMRPAIDVSSRSCQPQHGARCLGRRAPFQMAFNERQGGVSRPANGTVDLFNMHLSYSSFTYPSFVPFCAYAQAPLKFQGLFLSSFDTKETKRDLSQTCRAELCLGTLLGYKQRQR